MASPLFPTVVLCDLILKDTENKHSLIGVYSGDLLVSDFPARMRLGIYLEFLVSENGKHSVDLELRINDKRFVKGTIAADVTDSTSPVAFAFPGFEINVPEACTLKAIGSINGSSPEVILSKDIRLKPSASSVASNQKSPSAATSDQQ